MMREEWETVRLDSLMEEMERVPDMVAMETVCVGDFVAVYW